MNSDQRYEEEFFPAFAAASASFGGKDGSAAHPEKAKVAILPVPYDGTTTYIPGARQGPNAILQASQHLELFDDETGQEVFRVGIATLEEMEVDVSSPQAMVAKVKSFGEKILDGGFFPLMLGGEHSRMSYNGTIP